MFSNRKNNFNVVSPVTRDFVREAWKSQHNVPWDFLHSYLYARWPYLYISIAAGEHWIAKVLKTISRARKRLIPRPKPRRVPHLPSPTQASGTAADIYHGKVMPLKSVKELVLVDEPINLPDLEQVIPYVRARALIRQVPDHILAVKCACRMARENPCLPLDVCLVIGEPFASFTIQHYPTRARWITQEEACEILEREDARGRVHHAFFAEMMLGRMFAICNCCSCCCTAMKSHQKGTPTLASSGYIAQIDQDQCLACGTCAEYCQFNALVHMNGSTIVDEELCMGCGVCVSKCSQAAISLHLEPSRGKPLEIFDLIHN